MRFKYNQAIRIVAGNKDAGRRGRHFKTFMSKGITWHLVVMMGQSVPVLYREGLIEAVPSVKFRSQSLKHTTHVFSPLLPGNNQVPR